MGKESRRPVCKNQANSELYESLQQKLSCYLLDRGYSNRTVEDHLRSVRHFCWWLQFRRILVTDVSEAIVNRFLKNHFPSCRCPTPTGGPEKQARAGLNHLLEFLRNLGLIACIPKSVEVSPVEMLLEKFEMHLQHVGGTSISTAELYARQVRELLNNVYGTGPIEISRLTPQLVRTFVLKKAATCQPKTMSSVAASLRSFFRFTMCANLSSSALVQSVPTVANHSRLGLPKYLSGEQLKCLLSSYDVNSPIGLRDRAMALLMARLGLRGSEVSQLTLDAIDWQQAIITLEHSKSRRMSTLPLLRDVGEAIAAYLQHGRIETTTRNIFVTHAFPKGKPLSATAVRQATRRAFRRSNLPVPSYGTHVLRHTLGTHLLRSGATLKEIADVLGHRNIETTTRYAKVDLDSLAEVASPWPEVD